MTASAAPRKRAGRLPSAPIDDAPAEPLLVSLASFSLRLDDVAPSPRNPRKSFDQDALDELADSIRAVGVLQPILVRDVLGPESLGHPERGPRWTIVAGERRWRAARLAGLEQIPANILDTDDAAAALQAAIVENVQRQDLSPLDLSNALGELVALGLTQAEAARRIGLTGGQSRVAHLLKLRELPADVQQVLATSEHLKTAHAEALTRWNAFPSFAGLVARTADADGWTAKAIVDPDFDVLDDALEHEHVDDDPPVLFMRVGHLVFERAECTTCPWGALVEQTTYGTYPDRFCLRPEHAQEIGELLKAERTRPVTTEGERKGLIDAAVTAAHAPVARATAGDAASHTAEQQAPPPLPKLADLGYSNYERLDRSNVPKACALGQCPCYGMAVDYDDQVTAICTDPSAIRAKRAQLTKARNAENERRRQEALAKLEAHMTTVSAVGGREMAVLAAVVTSRRDSWQTGRVAPIVEALQAGSVNLFAPAKTFDLLKGEPNGSALDKLTKLETTDALGRALVEAICRQDITLRFHADGGPSYGALADWYVGGLPKRATDDWQPPEAEAKKARGKA